MRQFLFLLSLVGLFACSREVDFDTNFEGERLVVHSFFTDNEVITGQVSKTVDPEGAHYFDSLWINTAQFVVFENGSPFDTLEPLGVGQYRGQRIPNSFHFYYIKVIEPNFEPLISTVQVLPTDFSCSIANIAQNSILSLNTNYRTVSFDLTIDDVANEANFYQIEVDLWFENVVEKNIWFWYPNQSDFTANPCLTDQFYFPDNCFDGTSITLDIALETVPLNSPSPDSIEVRVRSLTDDYYQYIETNDGQPEDFEIPFSTPIFLYSNTENGYGIFGGFKMRKMRIVL